MDADPSSGLYETLLPGESASIRSTYAQDASHWVRVYRELCGFKEKLLDEITSQRDKVGSHGRIEVDHDDMVFRREYNRLKRRLDYWEAEEQRRSA